MVWNSTQSALYKAVSDFNNGSISDEKNCCKTDEKIDEKKPLKDDEKINDKFCEKTCEKCCEKCCKNCANNSQNYCGKNPISGLFSDSDFMMIAALILILLKNGADQKIIFALIFVLIS